MKIFALVPAVLAAAVLLIAAAASAGGGNIGFGFNARGISGFPTGAARLTGGGAYNPTSGFVHSAGGFRCTSDVGQGPLKGCLAGEGVRWDTVDLRTSTTFKCTGAAAEQEPAAVTDENTVGLDAGLLPRRRRERRVLHRADDCLRRGHCTRHSRDPERLDSGRRLCLGDRKLQLLTAARRRRSWKRRNNPNI
jgi:hypothetical protein